MGDPRRFTPVDSNLFRDLFAFQPLFSKARVKYYPFFQFLASSGLVKQELPRKAGAAKNVETFSISKKFRQRPSTEHRPDLKNLKNTPS